MHVQPKLGAHSQLIGPRCIRIHQDHQALWEMVCAKMRNEVNLSGAQAMVMVVGLWQDGILRLSMGKDKPVCHVMPMPMDWVVFFTPNLWHGVWKANPEATGARASIAHRGYLAPEFLKDSVVTRQDAKHLFEVPVDLESRGVQVFTLSAGFLIAVSPRRHHNKHHFFDEWKMSWDVLPESRHCPGDRRACQAGPHFNFREGASQAMWPSRRPSRPPWQSQRHGLRCVTTGSGSTRRSITGIRVTTMIGTQWYPRFFNFVAQSLHALCDDTPLTDLELRTKATVMYLERCGIEVGELGLSVCRDLEKEI